MQSDDEVIMRVLKGEKDVYEVLMDRHQDSVFKFACYRTGNREQAQEITHDAFVRAYIYLKNFRLGLSFRSYLYRIAENLCKDKSRAQNGEMITAATDQNSDPDVETTVIQKEWLNQGLWSLPAEYKEPIVMRYLHQCTYDEIASALNMPVGTIKTNIFRGKRLLLKNLGKE